MIYFLNLEKEVSKINISNIAYLNILIYYQIYFFFKIYFLKFYYIVNKERKINKNLNFKSLFYF